MSDQDRISSYNINMTSSRQVMGKQKMSMRVSLKIWLDSKLTAVKIEKSSYHSHLGIFLADPFSSEEIPAMQMQRSYK